MSAAAYFSITENDAFQTLAYGDVTRATSSQTATNGVIEISMSKVNTAGVAWDRATLYAALENLIDYLTNTETPPGVTPIVTVE